ncbi:MAG: hypothetical protein M1309_05725 [Actinobacteria bacterium]|nr:hypothetical protein [Actinomycetota bacterium]
MSAKELLYVAYKHEHTREEDPVHGISYAIYLSKLLGQNLRILLLGGGSGKNRLASAASAVASVSPFPHVYAEAAAAAAWAEDNSAETVAAEDLLRKKCCGHGIDVDIHLEPEANAAAIVRFLRQMKIDLVLLSPAVTDSRIIHKRLVRSSPRPVVSMARGAHPETIDAWAGVTGA